MIHYDWRAFLALEDDFLKTLDFVEFHKDNYKTFSIRYRSIILQACTEIESLTKLLYHGNEKYSLFQFIQWNYKKNKEQCLSKIEVLLPLFNEKFFPWSGDALFKKGINPDSLQEPNFWSAYNNIKHDGKNAVG